MAVAAPAAHPGTTRILAITADEAVADDVLRLGAAVGVGVTVVPDVLSAVAGWSDADLVVLDADAVIGVRTLSLPQRSRTVLIAPDPVPPDLWHQAMSAGVGTVVTLPAGEAWLVEAFAEAAGRLNSAAPVITVVGARGGVGASVLAVSLARVAAAEGLSSYLLDLDPVGPGVNVLLGVDQLPGNGWHDLASAVGRVPPRSLRQGLPTVAGIKLLTWTDRAAGGAPVALAPAAGVAGSVLESAARDADVVVVDLPRWMCLADGQPGATALEVLTRSDQVVLVSTADVRAALAARRLLQVAYLAGLRSVGLLVRGPSPGGLTGDDLAEALGLPLLAYMPAERGLDRALEDGSPPGRARSGPLRAASLTVLRHVAQRLGRG